jgi:hypothetical protein
MNIIAPKSQKAQPKPYNRAQNIEGARLALTHIGAKMCQLEACKDAERAIYLADEIAGLFGKLSEVFCQDRNVSVEQYEQERGESFGVVTKSLKPAPKNRPWFWVDAARFQLGSDIDSLRSLKSFKVTGTKRKSFGGGAK